MFFPWISSYITGFGAFVSDTVQIEEPLQREIQEKNRSRKVSPGLADGAFQPLVLNSLAFFYTNTVAGGIKQRNQIQNPGINAHVVNMPAVGKLILCVTNILITKIAKKV